MARTVQLIFMIFWRINLSTPFPEKPSIEFPRKNQFYKVVLPAERFLTKTLLRRSLVAPDRNIKFQFSAIICFWIRSIQTQTLSDRERKFVKSSFSYSRVINTEIYGKNSKLKISRYLIPSLADSIENGIKYLGTKIAEWLKARPTKMYVLWYWVRFTL